MLSKAHNSRDELAGLCFATPILAEFISWWIIGPLFFGAFFCTSFIKKPSVRIKIGIIGLSLTAIYIFHVVFFFATPSDLFFVVPVRKELIISLALITIYYVTRLHQFNLQQIIKTFFWIVILIGTLSALAGLIKLGLQDRGILIPFLIDSKTGVYPQGTSFGINYNTLGLFWLLSINSAFAVHLRYNRFGIMTTVPIVLSAGLLVGSRRFLIFSIVLLVFWIFILLKRRQTRTNYLRLSTSFALIIFSSILIYNFVANPDKYARFVSKQQEKQAYQISQTIKPNETDGRGESNNTDDKGEFNDTDDKRINLPNRTYAEIILPTISKDMFDARWKRWGFGIELFRENIVTGSGYRYQKKYSKNFVGGQFHDYPHFTLISEFLIGGIVLGILALWLYILIFYYIFTSTWESWYSGINSSFFLILPYALFSGDSIFSNSIFLSIILLLDLNRNAVRLQPHNPHPTVRSPDTQ